MSLSSASLGLGGEIGLWFGGLFTAAELAAADQLVQLSGGGGGDEASPSTSSSSSQRSVNTCCTATAAAGVEVEVEAALGALGMELDLDLDERARKRYRFVSELYATTRQVRGSAATKRKRADGESPPEAEARRYGERY